MVINAVWDSKSSNNFDSNFDSYMAGALLSHGRSIGTKEDTFVKYNVKTLPELALKQ